MELVGVGVGAGVGVAVGTGVGVGVGVVVGAAVGVAVGSGVGVAVGTGVGVGVGSGVGVAVGSGVGVAVGTGVGVAVGVGVGRGGVAVGVGPASPSSSVAGPCGVVIPTVGIGGFVGTGVLGRGVSAGMGLPFSFSVPPHAPRISAPTVTITSIHQEQRCIRFLLSVVVCGPVPLGQGGTFPTTGMVRVGVELATSTPEQAPRISAATITTALHHHCLMPEPATGHGPSQPAPPSVDTS